MTAFKKVFRDEVPALRFIGKEYPDFGPWWGDWFSNGWFDRIEEAMGGPDAILKIWENGDGYVGLERRAEGKPFSYWIGMFTPAGTPVPEGFACLDFPAGALGTVWIYGPEGEVHGAIPDCAEAVAKEGIKVKKDADGFVTSFENGLCPRFTTPDADGCVILDYCFYTE